jgi:hypothetical protein
MTDNGQPKPARKGHRFAPGHPHYPRKGPSPLTIRQRRKRDLRLVDAILAKIADDQAAGLPADATDVTRLIGTRERLEREI